MSAKHPSIDLMAAAFDQAAAAPLAHDKCFSAQCRSISHALEKAYAAGCAAAREEGTSAFHELMLRNAAKPDPLYA